MQPPVQDNIVRDLLREVQRRVPAGQRVAQEAFTLEHRRPVLVKLNDLRPDTFYIFDEFTAYAFCDAVLDFATRQGARRVTISYPFFGEFQAQHHRLEHAAGKVSRLRVLTVGNPAQAGQRNALEVCDTTGTALAAYRLALTEGARPVLFIGQTLRSQHAEHLQSIGFFTCDTDTVDAVANDIDLLTRGLTRRLDTFERLQLLHQTTQRVARELESYSRRIESALRRAQRRPGALTASRVDHIVGYAIAKIEQLKELPRRALRTIGKNKF
jgi:hypothetical protein